MSITLQVTSLVQEPSSGTISMPAASPAFTDSGGLLRSWRERRRLSQMALAERADISTRHLSFIETGRATPSRSVLLRLLEALSLPLRARNLLLVAAGYAPVFAETPFTDASMESVRMALQRLVTLHEPYPALIVDRAWNVVLANAPAALFLEAVADDLKTPPLNVMRLSLHPRGLAPVTINFAEWAGFLLGQLRGQVEQSADATLEALMDEVLGYPGLPSAPVATPAGRIVTAVRYRLPAGELALFTTIATLGAPVDVTADELAIECFFPADQASAMFFQQRMTAGTAAMP